MNEVTTGSKFKEPRVKDLNVPAQEIKKLLLIADTATDNLIMMDMSDLGFIMASLSGIYRMEGEKKILDFLENRKDSIHMLFDIHKRLQKYFPNSPISMKALQNDLIISIGTTFNPDEAIDRLDRFDDDWWLDRSSALDSGTSICIRVEYL
jgi:hypothetical protein